MLASPLVLRARPTARLAASCSCASVAALARRPVRPRPTCSTRRVVGADRPRRSRSPRPAPSTSSPGRSLWMLGLWMGARQRAAATPLPDASRAGWSPSPRPIAADRLRLAPCRRPGAVRRRRSLNLLFDKWQLGPLRLLDLFALMVLAMRFGPGSSAHLPRLRALETLGAASLPVFCAHLVIALLALAHPRRADAGAAAGDRRRAAGGAFADALRGGAARAARIDRARRARREASSRQRAPARAARGQRRCSAIAACQSA